MRHYTHTLHPVLFGGGYRLFSAVFCVCLLSSLSVCLCARFVRNSCCLLRFSVFGLCVWSLDSFGKCDFSFCRLLCSPAVPWCSVLWFLCFQRFSVPSRFAILYALSALLCLSLLGYVLVLGVPVFFRFYRFRPRGIKCDRLWECHTVESSGNTSLLWKGPAVRLV